MSKFLSIFVLCFTLVGCSAFKTALPIAIGQETIADQAPSTFDQATKYLTITHLAYNQIGEDLIVAANMGALKGAQAEKARVLFAKCGKLLDAADQAHTLANTKGMFAAINEATTEIALLSAIVHS